MVETSAAKEFTAFPNISTYVRVRPNPETAEHTWTDKKIVVGTKEFNYMSAVIGQEAPQEEAFNSIIQPEYIKFMDGHDVTTMAYGQTGSGKTHTMFGPRSVYKTSDARDPDLGIMPRAILQVL